MDRTMNVKGGDELSNATPRSSRAGISGKQLLAGTYRGALRVLGGRGLGKIYPVSVFKHWLGACALPQLKTTQANVHGHVMRLDALDSLGLSIWGTWEPFETKLIQTLVQPGDVVIDAGANIGYYSLLLARRVGAGGHVYAFEPAPDNFAILQENIERNGYRNITAEQKALADVNGRATLMLSNTNYGDHRLQTADSGSALAQVETITLDSYLAARAKEIALVKMDVQGAELRVLRGMMNLLMRRAPLKLLVEFFPAAIEQMGQEPRALLALLQAQGFTIEEIIEETRELRAVDEAWYRRERFGAEGFANLLCIRLGQ